MSLYRDKARGCYVFEFDRVIEGKRIRARKLLPKTWTRTQADAYDRQESAKLYALATRVERREYTIEDAVAIYLKDRVPHLKSGNNIIGELAQMFWAYQGKAMTDLSEVCKDYATKALREDGEPLAPATIRNRIRYLTSACRYGWKHHGMGDSDPAAKVVAPSVRNARQTYVNREQMIRLARRCRNRQARRAIIIAFYSGMRLGEILRAELQSGSFHLSDTKNGHPRTVPIHPKALAAARKFGQATKKITIQAAFRDARDKLGFGDLKFHDLRHSAASEMINAGVDLYTVGAVLGHRDSRSTQRYAHLATSTLADAVSRIGRGHVKKSPTKKTKRAA